MEKHQVKKIKLPDAPGVYFFIGKADRILYIGKATSLKSRVRSYFTCDLTLTRGAHMREMIHNATTVTFEETDSVLEALILEARLIKKYKPKYNTRDKDDKSFNYVAITREEFPRVLMVREKEFAHGVYERKAIKYLFGPFMQGRNLKEALRIIRRILPYRDKCKPNVGKKCFNAQIGLCPGMCNGMITKSEYAKQIRHIVMFFKGKKKRLLNTLEREMHAAAKKLDFETADQRKRQLFGLQHIRDISLITSEKQVYERTVRIEGYDIAHTAGTNVVGVMTVVENGELQKNEYRKFNIKSFKGANDSRALAEVLSRRLGHPEWRLPHLIVADGGKAQKNAIERVLRENGLKIPVVSVVKDDKHRPREILGLEKWRTKFEHDILLANSEAHRFALSFHKKARRDTLLK